MAAKTADAQLCSDYLLALEQDLGTLDPHLTSLRNSVIGQ